MTYCRYKWKALLETVPKSLDAIPEKLILRHYGKTQRIMGAYRDGIKYGISQFTKTVYKSHRRVPIVQERQEDGLVQIQYMYIVTLNNFKFVLWA